MERQLFAFGIHEPYYAFETGIGDCGAQSMYFVALCRSLGIPARSTGGYQMIEGLAEAHVWPSSTLKTTDGSRWMSRQLKVGIRRTTRHPMTCTGTKRTTLVASIPTVSLSRRA